MSKKDKTYYEGRAEVSNESDTQLKIIRDAFTKNLSPEATSPKQEVNSNNDKVSLTEQFISKNNGVAVKTIEQNIDYKSKKLQIEEITLIKNKMDEMMKNPTEKQIKDGCEYLGKMVKISLDNNPANNLTPERKKYLESLEQLFGTISKGFDKGFDKVEYGLNSTFEKVKSLGRDKITAITDKQR